MDEGNRCRAGLVDWPLQVFDHIWQHFVVEGLAPLLVESVAASVAASGASKSADSLIMDSMDDHSIISWNTGGNPGG